MESGQQGDTAPRVDGEAQQLEGAGHRFSRPERRWETAQVTGRGKALGKTHVWRGLHQEGEGN